MPRFAPWPVFSGRFAVFRLLFSEQSTNKYGSTITAYLASGFSLHTQISLSSPSRPPKTALSYWGLSPRPVLFLLFFEFSYDFTRTAYSATSRFFQSHAIRARVSYAPATMCPFFVWVLGPLCAVSVPLLRRTLSACTASDSAPAVSGLRLACDEVVAPPHFFELVVCPWSRHSSSESEVSPPVVWGIHLIGEFVQFVPLAGSSVAAD